MRFIITTSASFNTANGFDALLSNTTGIENTGNGALALVNNTTGNLNTANGFATLGSNTTGDSNTAEGSGALLLNTTGSSNTANGNNALFHNTSGFQNVATGVQALFSNTTGFHNMAAGFQALLSNTTGNHNTADGDNALVHNTTGISNTAIGGHALDQNVTGSSNVALGFQAGFNITGSGNVCVGENISGLADESNVTRIGNIGSTAQANGVFVTVGAGGKLGFQASSRRYKDDIKPMDKASEALFALKPVSFRYKQEIDPARSPDFGLIAEDVATVNPALVARRGGQNRYRSLSSGLRDVAQRVPQRTPSISERAAQGRSAGKDNRRAKIWNEHPSNDREGTGSANPKSARPA